MKQAELTPARHVVALFNSSDDTVEMVKGMLDAAGHHCLVGCHMSDLKKGRVDFDLYLNQHKPTVVIFDISPPYRENWLFFTSLRERKGMNGLGMVLTTTNKARLDEAVGKNSDALEIVGKPYDLDQISAAIGEAMVRARPVTPAASDRPPRAL